jgi:hypothetical protein
MLDFVTVTFVISSICWAFTLELFAAVIFEIIIS